MSTRSGERTDPSALFSVLIWTCVSACVTFALARPLPPHGFVSGDQGVKLIAAKNAIAHPSRPFEIDLPRIANRQVEYLDRFYRVHGDHAHALQSPLFPVLSAPLIAVAGLEGAYVLPALSFVVFLPLVYAVSRLTLPRTSVPALVASAVLGHPLFFYAFEFWEHLPAVAVLAGATALVFRVTRGNAGTGTSASAGILAAVAILLRPEAVWYAVGLFPLFGRSRAGLAYIVGIGSVLATFAGVNLIEGGPLAGYHAGANLAALSDRWLSVRFERLQLWLIPSAPHFAVGLLGIGLAWEERFRGRMDRGQTIGLVAAALIALGSVLGQYPTDSLWHAWPLGAIVLVPLRSYAGLAPLIWVSTFTIFGVWLTSTHDGGAQWGPRILLIATPALTVLVASALSDTMFGPSRRHLRSAVVVVGMSRSLLKLSSGSGE